jgi:phospholipid/cholesterol/gamma-HCH transport system substrate-binding protein
MNRNSRAPASAATRKVNVRVGLFLAFGILVAGFAIFAIGSQSGMFESKTTLYAYFSDVSGLVQGAPVRLAGLDVGTVSNIEFAPPPRSEARVTMKIKTRYLHRVRRDTVVLIDSKGLLGDKILNMTLGSPSSPEVRDGDTLPTRSAASIEHITSKVDEALSAVTEVTKTANEAIKQLTTEQAREDFARIVHSTAAILEEVERGKGLAHRAFYDPEYAEQVEGILAGAHAAMNRLNSALERADHTLAEVEHGDGMAHEIIFGETGRDTMTGLRDAASGLAAIAEEVRDGKGLAHNLIYDPDNGQAIKELNEAAARLNRMMANLEKGRGTVGGLMVDPSVYEDLKTILGNVQRNVLLKALIRFTIKQGDIERPSHLRTRRVPPEPTESEIPVPPVPTGLDTPETQPPVLPPAVAAPPPSGG